MNKSSLDATPSNLRVFTALLLNFTILITPIAAVAARTERSSQGAGGRKQEAASKAAAKEVFANPAPAVPAASPIISASMTDSIENDDGDGKIDPTNGLGSTERIIYSTTISNSGTVDATGVQFTNTIDSHTTLVGGSLNVSPLAGDDSYDTIGNTLLEVGPVGSPSAQPKVTVGTGGSPKSVFDNDTEFLGDTFTLSKLQATTYVSGTVTAASTHGSVTMDGSGHFSYLPTAGYTGDDTFTYEIKDGGNLTSTATVTIHVNTQRVWYVQNNSGGTNQGTSENPFTSLASAQPVATAIGDIIYVFNGNNTTGNQNAGYTIQANNQRLIGEGVQLDAPVSVNGGPNPTVLRAAGTAAKIGNGAGDAVTVTNKSGVIIRGFTISDSANGIAVSYTAAGGGVTISNNSIAGGTGNAIDVTSSGAGAGGSATITNNAITAAGAEGIDINANGTGTLNITVDTNTIVSTGNGFDTQENGGACNVSFTNNTGISSGATAINIVRVTGTLSVTAFSGNQVAGTTVGNGVVFNNAIFDSNPATGATDALVAGTLTLGAAGAGNGVGLSGLVMVNTTGTLPFTNLTIFNESGRGIDANGSGSGTAGLTVTSGNLSVTATGGAACKLDGLNIDLQNAVLHSANSADNGVAIGTGSAVTGTFSATNASSITNATGDDFAVGAGTANITWNASLNNSSGGNVVDVTGHTGGTVSFTGSITDSVQGINLQANTGATINFSNTLNLSTTTNAAFTATGGGTVTATGSGSVITTTTGTALNVANTTIGSGGLNFQSISAGTGASGPTNGIILNNTGSTAGLTVTGNSSGLCGGTVTPAGSPGTLATVTNPVTADCTGGVIQKTTGVGVLLTSTQSLSLTRMRIINGGDDGIRGTSVTNMTLSNVDIEGNGNAVGESGMDFGSVATNLTGTVSFTNVSVLNSFSDGVNILNTGGTISSLTVTGCNFSQSSIPVSPAGGNGFNLKLQLTASLTTATLSNSMFRKNFSNGFLSNSENTSNIGSFTVTNSSFDDNNIALQCGQFNASTHLCRFVNNTVINQTRTATSGSNGTGQALVVGTSGASTGGTFNSRIDGNVIGSSSIAGSGSSLGSGIRAIVQGQAAAVLTIINNTIRECPDGFGMDIENLGSTSGTPPQSDVGIYNNNVNHIRTAFNPGTSDFPLPAIYVSGDNQGTAAIFRADVTGNTVPNAGQCAGQFLGKCMELFEYTGPTGDLRLRDNPPTGAASANAEVAGANTGDCGASAGVSLFTAAINTVAMNTAQPNQQPGQQYTARAEEPVHQNRFVGLLALVPFDHADFAQAFMRVVNDQHAIERNAEGATLIASASVGQQQSPSAPSLLSRATSSVSRLARSIDSIVEPSAYAAENTEARSQKSDVRLNHARSSKAKNSSALTAAAPFSGETVTFDNGGSGFTLPVGKSVTIVFKVTLDNLPNLSLLNPPRVSNQGRVFGTNFTLVNGVSSASPNTDDPAPPVLANGTHDATETLADLFNTTTAVQTSGSPSYFGDPVTFTATVSFNPTGSPSGTPGTPTGTVQFLDGASPITCNEGSTSTQTLNGSGVATCTTSTLSAAAHTINVNYNGDGNFDTSSGNVSQTVNPCTNNPIVTSTADSGAGSLRDAIVSACSGTTIDFNIAGAGPHTITLTTGELSLTRNVTIQNTSGKTIIVSGGGTSRVFDLASNKTASISNITVTNGNAGAGNGGGIQSHIGSTLTLTNVTVSNSTAGGGGGVSTQCSSSGTTIVIVKNSTISGNTASGVTGGGGIGQDCGGSSDAIYVDNSTINGNHSTNSGGNGGGGISTIPSAILHVSNSTISNNDAVKEAGGIYSGNGSVGPVRIINTTISGNSTPNDGGGLWGAATLVNSTITNNRADSDNNASGTGGGISVGTSVSLLNTIVSGNFSGSGSTASDIAGVGAASGSFNLIGTGGSGGLTNGINNNQVGVADAFLGALANNGGATQTHKLLSNSTAIEAGTDVTTLSGNGGSITNVATSVIVADATAIPQNVSFVIQVDNEQMSVTSKSGNTLTVVRGVNGTSNVTHNDGAAVNPAFDQRGSGFPRKADSADANTTQTVDIGAYEAHPTVEDITDKSTAEDTGFNFNFNIGDGTTTPTLITSVTATSNNAALVPNGNLSVTGSGATRNLAITPVANANTPTNGTATITVTVTATNAQTATDTFVLTVTAVADTPSVTNASTTVNVQTTSGLVISRNVNDSTETAFFKITNIQNGTLFKNDGITPINNNDFITFAEGNAGLKFTPANNSTTSGSFNVQGSNDNVGTGLSSGSATATITVTKNASNVAVTSSQNPSFQNQSVTFTATVSSATSYTGTPTGNVDFFDNLVAIPGCSARPLDGSGVATCTTSALSNGSHPISATYNGDAAFLSNSGNLNTNPQVVNPALALVVNTTDDTVDANVGNGICADVNGNCSLRAAIQETNFAPSDDTITFANGAGQAFDPATAPHTITLLSSLPDVTSNLTITGPGPKATAVTISGNNLFRILNVSTAGVNLNLNVLAFTAGKVGGGQNASAIEFNTAGTLTIDECEVFNNNVDLGTQALYANGSTGIVIGRSTFRGNVNAMMVEAVPTFTVKNSTIANNAGRGIYNLTTSLVITNSTIADNSVDGIFNDATGHAVAASLGNTLLSNNNSSNLEKTGANTNTFTSNGHNLIDDNSGAANLVAPGAGDLLGTSVIAGLVVFGDYGGPTQTRRLASNSQAFDAGDDTLATNAGLTTDQRGAGFARIFDGPDANSTATSDIGAYEAQGAIEDITDKSTNEDTQLQFTFNVSDQVSSTDVTATSSNQTIVPDANIVITGASSPLTLTLNPAANQNTASTGPITITVTVTKSGISMSDTFLLTVVSVPDAPSVTGATTNEDVQTTSGLVVTKNGADGSDVAFFKITNILNGSLFKNDGTTPIANGGVISEAEGNAGLKFTPAANFFGTAHFDVQAALANDGSGAGQATTANVTVNAVADTPSITGTTTNEDTQSTTGLVISRNPADGAEVTNFKITNITGGTLFQNNGTTQINNGDFITFAQGNAGLKFTPAADAYTPANTFGFDVQASTTADNSGLGGSTTPASITVTPIADTPSVTNSTTNEDVQTTTGLVISRNAVDGNEVAFFKITNITNGSLFKNDGTTPISNNQFITFAEGNAGLKFTPAANFFGNGSFQVYGSIDNAGTGLSANFATATITVSAVADTPSITPTTTNEDTQSTSGLVITKNAIDGAEVTFFKITGITNGTLFQNNGTTQINNGDFITVAQGGAGLKFTPAANLYSPGSSFTFNAAGATDNVGGGLGSTTPASITVNAVADSPNVTPNPQNTAIATQTGPMVISRNAADGNEVTHFKITNITNGVLYQNDGTTPINNNDFITFAQGNAGLKFSPTGILSSPANSFGFDVQASLNNTNGGLGGGIVHEDIIVSCSDPQSVTSILDDGSAGTLRYAIANSCSGSGVVTFALPVAPQTITLGSPLTIDKTLQIIGPTNYPVTINGNGNRVLNVTTGSPSISNLTFTGALVSGSNGGGLRNTSTGTLTFNGVTFSGNSADNGGAIATTAGAIVINNSTISGNTATTDGGGIWVNGGAVTLLNDTITNNTATAGQGGGLNRVSGTVNVKNTIIAGNTAPANGNVAGTINDQGNNILSGNPQLAPLANNGGPTMTHALKSNSPALDAGDNAAAGVLATDQRGNPFGRFRDAANDADTTATVDIGSFEADPSVEDIQDKTTNEDTALPTFSFRVADTFSAFDSIVGTSNNQTLVPDANILVSGGGNTRNLDITPAANQFGTATITVTVTKTVNSTVQSMSDTFVLTVNPVGDTPNVTNATTNEDTQSTSGLVITRNAADGAEIANFKITNITGGVLFKNDGVTPINNNDFITFAEGNAGLKFTPAANLNSAAGDTFSFQVQGSRDAIGTGLSAGAATATITVNAVNDVPSFTKGGDQTVLANSGAQTVNGWATALSKGPANESGQVLDFIVNNNNNTLFSTQPAVSATGVLTYTPATNQNGTAIVSVQIHDNGGTAFGGVDTSAVQTFNITVNRSATTTTLASDHNPSFTNQLVTFTATVTSNTAVVGPPTGTVQFFEGVNPLTCSNGNTSTEPVDGTGKAICQISTLTTAGSPHSINSTYSGDGAYLGSTSNIVSQNVTPPLTLTVNDTGDTPDAVMNGICADSNGKCTLRAAIQEANFAASDDTINFSLPANSTINLLTALPNIDGNVVINGPGANTLTVQRSTAGGTPNFRVFAINGGRTVSISGLTISNGSMVNAAGNDGAGIFNQGTLTLTASTISGNTTPRSGGGVANNGGTLTITGCTISGNNAGVAGSGVASSGTLTITNSTISGNATDGLSNSAPGVATLVNDTFSGNTVRGISNNGGATVNIGNTIVGNTPAGAADVTGTFNSLGNNVIGNASGSTGFTNGVNGDKVGATGAVLDPRVGPLANNGGATQTNALLSGSPALDAGNNTLATNNSLTTDQRGVGFGRFIDGVDADAIAQVDIGAFEAQPSIEDITNKSTNEDTALPSFNFTVADGGVSNFTVTASSSNTTLVPNGNINVGGAGSTRSLSITPATNQNGTTTITVTAAGTIGATPVSMADTFVLTVNAVNDAPTFNLNAGPVVNEDSGPQTIAGQAMNISAGPADESGQLLAFTVTNNNNALFSVQPAISPTGTLTFTSAPDANGTATVSVTLKDNGGTANGGQDTSATQQFTITVNAVNDAPVNTVPGAQQVTENSTLTFSTANANALSIADVDAGAGQMRETLTATNGTITLGSTAGLAFTVGNGTANSTMTFTGTIAAVNTALQGMTFNPTNGFSGAATLTIVTNDQGNTGSGGALSDTDVVNITVNDGGTLQLSAATYTVAENSGPAVITITRTGGTAGTATVKIDTSNGTATAGSDYTAVSQTVTFLNGETSKNVNIPITDDLLNEPDETVNITLSNAGGSGALGTPATAVLTITNDDPAGGYIKFSTSNYNVNEGGVATITVQRTGTLTQAVTIDFATTDNSDPASFVSCAPTPGNTLASSRCDFDSAFGRISFAAGDGADKTFTVMTQQDNYVEGPETLTLTLSNPTGGAGILGLSTATLTIIDDVSEPATNPVDDTNNFVESLYRDFLNRASDPAGKAFWVQNIDKCNDPAQRPPNLTQAQCIAAFRVSTAAAFFLSDEYQQTGGVAYLTNKVAFGGLPTFLRFERDAQMLGKGYVGGAPGADAVLEANKVAYFNDYVSRPEFVNTYGPLSNQQYVDTLTQNTGVVWGVGEKQQLVDGLNNATLTRAQVLRKITEKPEFRTAERESMFVLTEYFGFLRRNPDQAGFNFWLNKLHAANGNAMQAEMVRAFVESPEYRQRFGQ